MWTRGSSYCPAGERPIYKLSNEDVVVFRRCCLAGDGLLVYYTCPLIPWHLIISPSSHSLSSSICAPSVFPFNKHSYRLSCHLFCFSYLFSSCVLISFCVIFSRSKIVVASAGVRGCLSLQPHYEWACRERERERLSRYVGLYICIYTYTCIHYLFVCMHYTLYACMFACGCMHACLHVCMSAYEHIWDSARIALIGPHTPRLSSTRPPSLPSQASAYTRPVSTHTHTHTHTHAQTHTMYTHIYTDLCIHTCPNTCSNSVTVTWYILASTHRHISINTQTY